MRSINVEQGRIRPVHQARLGRQLATTLQVLPHAVSRNQPYLTPQAMLGDARRSECGALVIKAELRKQFRRRQNFHALLAREASRLSLVIKAHRGRRADRGTQRRLSNHWRFSRSGVAAISSSVTWVNKTSRFAELVASSSTSHAPTHVSMGSRRVGVQRTRRMTGRYCNCGPLRRRRRALRAQRCAPWHAGHSTHHPGPRTNRHVTGNRHRHLQ